MAYVRMSNRREFVLPKNLKPGDFAAEGILKGYEASTKFPNQHNVIIRSTDETKPVTYVVPLTGSLKVTFEDSKIQPGDKILLNYAGVSVLKTGKFAGKECHNWEVFKDDDTGFEEGEDLEEEPLPSPEDSEIEDLM